MTLTAFPPPDPGSIAPDEPAPPPPVPTLPPASGTPGPSLPRSLATAGTPTPPPNRIGRGASFVLVLAVLAVLMVLLAVAALPVLQGGDDPEPSGAPTTSPSASLELRPAPSPAPPVDADPVVEPEPTPDAATEPPAPAPAVEPVAEPAPAPAPTPEPAAEPASADAGDVPAVEAPVPEPAPEGTVAADPEVEVTPAEVPESKAVVRNGQIFLEGAVPTAESGAAIASLAAEILGPDNVFNNYFVDPRASDPNLGNVTVEDTINFATGSAVILPEGETLMNQALALMTIRPSVTVIVVGHTDSRGSDEYNRELSRQRALAVKTWLTDRGIDGERLTIVGKGESEPIADNSTAEGQRLNRRIQFFIENLLADS